MDKKTLTILFRETFLVSMFTFGGGYVIVPMMKKKFVEELAMLTEDEMLDMIAIAQSCPGALAINVAIILGYKIAKFVGALTACVATVLPPLLIITVISMFYETFRDNIYVNKALLGMATGVSAIILVAAIGMIKPMLQSKINIGIILIGIVSSYFLSPVVIILSTILLSSIYTYFKIHKKEEL